MKSLRSLLVICAALFLSETGGANFVLAQKRPVKAKKTVRAPVAKPASLPSPKPDISANAPTVTKIDFEGLKALLKSNALAKRPLLINFWATWCPPCREEFPELVQIDRDFRPRDLAFVTISLDDLAEIERDVPAFLTEMKATMPAYLLKTADEEAAIYAIAPDWRGALPLTVLYDPNGKPVFTRMGAIKPDILRLQIEKVMSKKDK